MSDWTAAASATASLTHLEPELRRPLDRALDGYPIDADAAHALIAADDPSTTAALLAVAGHLRTRHKGTVVTFSPKVFLPITNLCRDRCSYCTFRADPEDANAWTMLPEEVHAASRGGFEVGCVEALMCLGDKPEKAFRSYRTTLSLLGASSTIDYVARCCEIALAAGLLPHTNAGVLTADEMRLLRPTNVSLGLMLENVSPRLRGKDNAHYYAPDKDPLLRLRMIEQAGELGIPFTTGILLGIGETLAERVDSLVAIRDVHARHGHIQEIIVQNFRAKPSTRMSGSPEPEAVELARAIAVARLLMPTMNVQAPPNLSPRDHRLLLDSGINDWGGISPLTPDYVNPEAPWPHLDVLAATCREAGFTLRPRLPIYAEYLDRPEFLDARLLPAIEACAARKGITRCP